MPDIFDEVEEDLRAERARRFGRRFAGWGIAAFLLTLLGTAGYVYWQQATHAAQDATAARFIEATKLADKTAGLNGKTDVPTAEADLQALAAQAPDGYHVLALLRLAALQWQQGQTKQAIASWQSVSDDQSAPQLLRDMATLLSAQHQVDSGDPVLLKQRLQSLTAPDNHWRPLAEQMIALLDIRQGKLHDAALIMQRLSIEPGVPQGIRQMAADVLTTLPDDALATPPLKSAAPAAAPTHG